MNIDKMEKKGLKRKTTTNPVTIRKKGRSLNIEDMKKERELFYKGLEKIEVLKRKYYEKEVKETDDNRDDIEEIFSVLLRNADRHPGREVFIDQYKYQCFVIGDLISQCEKSGYRYDDLRLLLQYGWTTFTDTISKTNISQLFYFMSIEDDYYIVNSCFDILLSNVHVWTPKLEDVCKVFLNWGATYDSLKLTSLERSVIFPEVICLQVRNTSHISTVKMFNYEKVFAYVGLVISRKNKLFIDMELIILSRCLLKMSFDTKMTPVVGSIRSLIGVCVNSIQNWNPYKVVNISSLIHDENDNIHNQVALVVEMLPKVHYCNAISSCLSLTVLRYLITAEIQYLYPFDDSTVLHLIDSFEPNPESGEDFYKLYLIVYLLNHIVYHGDLMNENPSVMQGIKSVVEALKWEMSKSKRTLDLHLLRGRISYCVAVWDLFRKKNSQF